MAETLDVTSMIPQKFEPKRKNRFVFQIEGIDAYLVKAGARPEMTVDPIQIEWMNVTRYLAGKLKFSPISITLHDALAPSAAQQVMEWVRLSTETVSGRAGYADFYKRDVQLKLTDPIGTVIELWELKGAFVTSANFGDLSYDSADLAEIAMTIQYDNAVLIY